MVESPVALALVGYRAALAGVRLPFALPGRDETQAGVRAQLAQLDDYILPRLADQDAPLLAVVSGPTGAGKSTLVNSIAGRVVSDAGVIRPTTLAPVLVHHPADAQWFTSDRILPGLARGTQPTHDPRTVQLVADTALPPGIAFVDAPDIDSVVTQNRQLASQLLAAADLWLFVTTASRYADAVPWGFLRGASERDAVVAVVLDRVPAAALAEVPGHLRQMMAEAGLGGAELFVVPESELDGHNLLPVAAVEPIRRWLAELARDAQARARVVNQTLGGAIDALMRQAPAVADAATEQADCLDRLRGDAEAGYREAIDRVAEQTSNGVLMRGEVLARWQDFIGTGEFLRSVEQKIGWFRDRVGGVLRGEPKQAAQVQVAVETGLEVLIREAGESAARRVAGAWDADPGGRELRVRELNRPSPDFPRDVERAIRAWQGDVLALVTETGASKRARARFLALGVNGVGVALMILVFSQTGGLLGAEIGIAGGTALLAQKLLEAVFGDDAVRRLTKQAKRDLDARVEGVLAGELSRYLRVLDEVDLPVGVAGRVRDAGAAVAVARELGPKGVSRDA